MSNNAGKKGAYLVEALQRILLRAENMSSSKTLINIMSAEFSLHSLMPMSVRHSAGVKRLTHSERFKRLSPSPVVLLYLY